MSVLKKNTEEFATFPITRDMILENQLEPKGDRLPGLNSWQPRDIKEEARQLVGLFFKTLPADQRTTGEEDKKHVSIGP